MSRDIWKDVTSYSRGDQERKPRAFEIQIAKTFRLVVVWNHRDYPNEWIYHLNPVFTCARLNIDKYEYLEAAKAGALMRVKRLFNQSVVELSEYVKQKNDSSDCSNCLTLDNGVCKDGL